MLNTYYVLRRLPYVVNPLYCYIFILFLLLFYKRNDDDYLGAHRHHVVYAIPFLSAVVLFQTLPCLKLFSDPLSSIKQVNQL